MAMQAQLCGMLTRIDSKTTTDVASIDDSDEKDQLQWLVEDE